MSADSNNFVILVCTILIQCQGVTDGQKDGQTDGQTPRPWLRRAKHSAIERKNHPDSRNVAQAWPSDTIRP